MTSGGDWCTALSPLNNRPRPGFPSCTDARAGPTRQVRGRPGGCAARSRCARIGVSQTAVFDRHRCRIEPLLAGDRSLRDRMTRMITEEAIKSRRRTAAAVRMPAYGWAGLASMVLFEILLFSTHNALIGWFFTPIQWTGL